MMDQAIDIDYAHIVPGRRLIAAFVPEAWVNDYAVETDGRATFDATKAYLAMTPAERAQLRDNRNESDALVPEELLKKHGNHPFHVEIEDAMRAFHEADDERDDG